MAGVESKLEDIIAIIIEQSSVLLLLVASVDISKHALRSLVCDVEGFMLTKEEHKALFLIVDDLLPEIVSFLVAFPWDRTVDSAGIDLLVDFETDYHQERVAGEGLQEQFLVVHFDLSVDLPEQTVLVFLVYFVLQQFVLLLAEPLAVERCLFLDCRLQLQPSQTHHDFLL